MKKIRVGILFGGQSAEHEVSIRSAKNVYDALDKSKYEPVLIGISKKGEWLTLSEQEFLELKTSSSNPLSEKNVILHSVQDLVLPEMLKLVQHDKARDKSLDVVFPVLHGPMGG
jgi:D-alanine-D-alanine ligase